MLTMFLRAHTEQGRNAQPRAFGAGNHMAELPEGKETGLGRINMLAPCQGLVSYANADA